jgi:hypothetical protein
MSNKEEFFDCCILKGFLRRGLAAQKAVDKEIAKVSREKPEPAGEPEDREPGEEE